MIQWIVVNPVTKEGLVTSPKKPLHGSYLQVLEWAGLLLLRTEVQKVGGGDIELNDIYIRSCETYCNKWKVAEPKVE